VPTALILGGVNGAGKTTLARALLRTPQLRGRTFLNADIFAAQLRRERPGMTLAAANFLGLRMVAEGHDRHLATGTSFVAETVLANASYRALCGQAQAAGFTVELAYVAICTVEESVARVRLRVAMGGHDVPEKDIRRRWALSHANLAWFVSHADEVRVYDNSRRNAAPRRIAHAVAGTLVSHIPRALPDVDRALAAL
jgi:predicted ABC-type ATPase